MLTLIGLRLKGINQITEKKIKSSVEWKNPSEETKPDLVIWGQCVAYMAVINTYISHSERRLSPRKNQSCLSVPLTISRNL